MEEEDREKSEKSGEVSNRSIFVGGFRTRASNLGTLGDLSSYPWTMAMTSLKSSFLSPFTSRIFFSYATPPFACRSRQKLALAVMRCRRSGGCPQNFVGLFQRSVSPAAAAVGEIPPIAFRSCQVGAFLNSRCRVV